MQLNYIGNTKIMGNREERGGEKNKSRNGMELELFLYENRACWIGIVFSDTCSRLINARMLVSIFANYTCSP